MKRLELAGLNVQLTGGTDRDGGGDGPLVVLLHGYGAPGDDLVPLSRVLDAPAGTRWAFPAAPIALPGMGYDARAWWRIDIEKHIMAVQRGEAAMPRETPAGMAEARDAVIVLLDELEAHTRPSKMVLGGFSQGAMLACDVALRTARPFGGIALLSGTLVARDEWARLAETRRGLRVFESHGNADPLLPFAEAEKLRGLLKDGGADVTWVPFRGGHEIPATVLDALGPWMRAGLG
jgi:phospholipase/carboxylesterase